MAILSRETYEHIRRNMVNSGAYTERQLREFDQNTAIAENGQHGYLYLGIAPGPITPAVPRVCDGGWHGVKTYEDAMGIQRCDRCSGRVFPGDRRVFTIAPAVSDREGAHGDQ